MTKVKIYGNITYALVNSGARRKNLLLEKYPRGSRGSPAKGVVCDECSEGSNPSFSAKNACFCIKTGVFLYLFLYSADTFGRIFENKTTNLQLVFNFQRLLLLITHLIMSIYVCGYALSEFVPCPEAYKFVMHPAFFRSCDKSMS